MDPKEVEALTGKLYLTRLPERVPDGKVLVHNPVKPARRGGTRGFRFWLQSPDQTVEECPCSWCGYAKELGAPHYQVKAWAEARRAGHGTPWAHGRTTTMTSDSSIASPKKKFTIAAFNAAISAEHRKIGYQSRTHILPPKTVPVGKVVVHFFTGGNKAWVQFPTDYIEPCTCGSWLFGHTHYRLKEGVTWQLEDPPDRRSG